MISIVIFNPSLFRGINMNKLMRKLSKSQNLNPTIKILRTHIKQAERSLNVDGPVGPGGGGPSPKADGSGDSGSFHYM
jgi:hypothetical protein